MKQFSVSETFSTIIQFTRHSFFSAGIGYSKDDQDKEWTHHQEGFNDLLMNLQKSQNMEPTELMESKEIALSGMSLEQKSKQSKARVQ